MTQPCRLAIALVACAILVPDRSLASFQDPSPPAVARAEAIGFRLGVSGVARCQERARSTGISFQVLGQFLPHDRPAAAAAYRLDRGPRILAVAPKSPAALAGLSTGDVVLAVNDRPLPSPASLSAPFDQAGVLSALDQMEALVAGSDLDRPAIVNVLRDGVERRFVLAAVPSCPLHLYIAQSNQRDAFADGRHVLLPVGLVNYVRDDNELALVIAHEMAHNILGHAAQLRVLAAGAHRRALLRLQEDAADSLGAELALDAGYDIIAGSKVFILSNGAFQFSPSHRDARGRMALMAERARLRGQYDR